MDLRESLELARHVRGCALLAENADIVATLGQEGEGAAEAGLALLSSFQCVGLRGEACFAASLDIDGGQLFARTFEGRLLVVRSDGEVTITDAMCEALIDALERTASPRDHERRFESGIRGLGPLSNAAND